jgi:hypothetical protein
MLSSSCACHACPEKFHEVSNLVGAQQFQKVISFPTRRLVMKEVSSSSSYAVLRVAVGGLALLFLSGCAATEVMISKRNLDVQTQMSETVFLDPVGPEKKIMHIQVRNTSDKDNFDIEAPLKEAMIKKGYRITEDPNKAYYRLQANVLSVAKTDPTAAAAALHGG